MYRAHLERYAASLAAASGNPSLALGAASSLSPYAMLAAGYPPTAMGLVPPSSIVQPPLHDPLASTAPSSLALSLPPKTASSSQMSNQNQNLDSIAASKPSIDNINQKAPSELAITTIPSVLQQRLSTPIDSLTHKDISHMSLDQNASVHSSRVLDPHLSKESVTTKDTEEPRKEKKKNKSGTSNKGKSTGKRYHI